MAKRARRGWHRLASTVTRAWQGLLGQHGLTRRGVLVALVAVLLLCSGASALTGIIAYAHYAPLLKRDRALAQDSLQHIHTAGAALKSLSGNPFNSAAIAQAQTEFARALGDLHQLQDDVASLPPGATLVPHYGVLLTAAEHVLPLAVTATNAGIEGCTLLALVDARLRNPLSASSTGLTAADLATIGTGLQREQVLLTTAQAELNQVQPGDLQLDPRLGPALATARADLPTVRSSLTQAQALLGVAPQVLGIGAPTNYLIEVLDATEIRPGGGFVGNYGTATVSGARLTSLHMTDTYLLDTPYQAAGNAIPIPPAYQWFPLAASWSLRDSNLDADFPTAARYAEQIYHTEGGTVALGGVIAITPYVIQNALQITGPIFVPGYDETITPQNLIDRIHYHQEGPGAAPENVPSPDGHSSLRKRFTELLFEQFFARVKALPPADLAQLGRVLGNALRSHDVQVYFNNARAEQALAHYHLASTIQDPVGDSLFIVDANIAANKANNFITYTLRDEVTLDAAGTATHTTTLTYAWPDTPASEHNNIYGESDVYRDYLRLYVPPGSTLQSQTGWQPVGTAEAFGRDVWIGVLTLPFGQTQVIALRWSTPRAALEQSGEWHYADLIQRQAGITWSLSYHLALPSCARSVGHATGLAVSAGHVATASLAVTDDTSFALEYMCG